MPDMVDEAVQKVGAAEPQPTRTSPKENSEEGKPPEPEKSEKPEEQKKDDTHSTDEQTLDTIAEKVEKGEELTEEEQAVYERVLVDQADKEVETADEEKINIAGKEFSKSQLEEQWRETWRIGNRKLAPESVDRLTEAWVKTQNRTAQQRAVEIRQRQVVTDKRELDKDRTATDEMRRQNEKHATELEAQRRQIENEKKQIDREKNRLLKLANQNLTKEDLYDDENRVDPDKQYQYNQQLDAKEKLSEITAREKEIQMDETNNQQALAKAQIDGFLSSHAEYKTSEDMNSVLDKIDKGYEVNEEDEAKVLELADLAHESSTKGLPIEKVYRLHKARGTLAVKPKTEAQTPDNEGGKPPLPELPERSKKAADLIRSYKKKMQLSGSSLGGGGYGRGSQKPPQTGAEVLLEAGRRAKGVEKDSFTKDELGY